MNNNIIERIAGVLFAILLTIQGNCTLTDTTVAPNKKELYIPAKVWMVPENNDYKNDTSEFCFHRMKESENIAIFWSKEFGEDPLLNPDTIKRFNADEILNEGERIYRYYVNDLRFVKAGESLTERYKVLIYLIGGNEGTAFGGGEEGKVGIFWAPPIRMKKAPFGALAHELGHSFQYLLSTDKANGDTTLHEGGGSYSFVEMTSQYMLWQVYPKWMTFENYHLVDFMKQTHLAFLHEKNMYHSPYVLEYWSNMHGIDFIGKIWWEGRADEDPVMTYKRLTSIDQQQFNDEIFDASSRFITWDMKRIEQVAKPYANQHFTKLDSIGGGWYQVAKSNCPQNYGYNGIKLKAPAVATEVTLNFNGTAGIEGFNAINVETAGWRYGFLAVKKDGSREYGKMFSGSNAVVKFMVPNDTEFLWLVVSGAPSEHRPHVIDGDDTNDEQWPYRIKLTGTTLDDLVIH